MHLLLETIDSELQSQLEGSKLLRITMTNQECLSQFLVVISGLLLLLKLQVVRKRTGKYSLVVFSVDHLKFTRVRKVTSSNKLKKNLDLRSKNPMMGMVVS